MWPPPPLPLGGWRPARAWRCSDSAAPARPSRRAAPQKARRASVRERHSCHQRIGRRVAKLAFRRYIFMCTQTLNHQRAGNAHKHFSALGSLVPSQPQSPQRHAKKMLISVAAIACSLLVRPPAVPLYRTPTPARLSSPQMATEELVEQFVDWVRLSKPCSPHVCPGHH